MLLMSAVMFFVIGFLNTVSGSGIADKQPGMGLARIGLGFVLQIAALGAAYAYGAGGR